MNLIEVAMNAHALNSLINFVDFSAEEEQEANELLEKIMQSPLKDSGFTNEDGLKYAMRALRDYLESVNVQTSKGGI